MNDERIDLSALTPALDDLARGIQERCAPLLAERRRTRMIVEIAGWRRPMLVAAALVAIASGVILARAPGEAQIATRPGQSRYLSGRTPTTQLATVLGVPNEMASRLTIRRPPTLSELMAWTSR